MFWEINLNLKFKKKNSIKKEHDSCIRYTNSGEGQRSLFMKHSIKTRKFIGNTTMDPQLALLMANLGKLKASSL